MECLKEIQRHRHNNRVAAVGYIKASIAMVDCPEIGAEYYVCTMPAGVIIKGVTAYLAEAEEPTDTASINILIGDNECIFCEDIPTLELTTNIATCVEDCKCKIVDKDYLVKVTIVEAPANAEIRLLFNIIMPEHIICAVKPVRLDTEMIIKPYCVTDECGCDCSSNCGDCT